MANITKPATHVAHIDESHGSASRRLLLLSACVLDSQGWADFSDAWYRVLHEKPEINAFHMRDARGLSGEFLGWSRMDVDLKVIALCEVIVATKMHTVTCWVDEDEYRETVAAASPPDLRNPYFICFQSMVILLARAQREMGFLTPVDYVFDDKGDTGKEALLWYFAMKETSAPEISSLMGSTPVLGTDENVLPLQAADIVAWRNRRIKETSLHDPELASSMRLDRLTRADIPLHREFLEGIAEKISRVRVAESKNAPSIYKELKSKYRKERRRNARPKNEQ